MEGQRGRVERKEGRVRGTSKSGGWGGVEGQRAVVTKEIDRPFSCVQNMPPSLLKSPLRFFRPETAGSSEKQSSQKTSRSYVPVCPFSWLVLTKP